MEGISLSNNKHNRIYPVSSGACANQTRTLLASPKTPHVLPPQTSPQLDSCSNGQPRLGLTCLQLLGVVIGGPSLVESNDEADRTSCHISQWKPLPFSVAQS